MEKKNDMAVILKALNRGIEIRIEALIVLVGELLMQLSNNKESTQSTREKAAAVLVAGGLTQERAAKLLSIKKGKVVKATKTIKL